MRTNEFSYNSRIGVVIHSHPKPRFAGSSAADVAAMRASLQTLPQKLEQVITTARPVVKSFVRRVPEGGIITADARAALGAAQEGALKIAEMAKAPSFALQLEEITHGWLYGLGYHTAAVLGGEAAEEPLLRAIAAKLEQAGLPFLVVSTGDPAIKGGSPLLVPGSKDRWTFPVTYSAVLQLVAWELAQFQRVDAAEPVNHLRFTTKSVS